MMSICLFALVKKIKLLNDRLDAKSAQAVLRLREKKNPNQKEQEITGTRCNFASTPLGAFVPIC